MASSAYGRNEWQGIQNGQPAGRCPSRTFTGVVYLSEMLVSVCWGFQWPGTRLRSISASLPGTSGSQICHVEGGYRSPVFFSILGRLGDGLRTGWLRSAAKLVA